MTTRCFCCRVLNDTCYQVLFELRCHVWSNLATIFFVKIKKVLKFCRGDHQIDGGIEQYWAQFLAQIPQSAIFRVVFSSNNGRNRSWCKCMVISRYDFVTKVTHDAQVQLREMFQMTKRSYFVVWPYPVKRKQWTELVPRSPKGRSRFLFQGTVLNILGCSHPGCQQQVEVL